MKIHGVEGRGGGGQYMFTNALQNVSIHAFWERVSKQQHINEC
jgi:hypothetical protein